MCSQCKMRRAMLTTRCTAALLLRIRFPIPASLQRFKSTSSSTEGFKERTDSSFATRAIHAAQDPESYPDSKPIVMPINLSTTFKQDAPYKFVSCEYSRTGNPTRNALENVLASLEGAKYGLAYSSGMAAVSTVINLLSAGDHIVSLEELYGGTLSYMKTIADRLNIKTTFVENTADPSSFADAIQENTKLIWLESPSNPSLKLVDIAKVVEIARQKGNGRILVAVDNTFLSPYFQRPLELGADIVMHSATKYLNGHSDVLMGCVLTSNEEVHTRLRHLQNIIGAVPSPFECYLVSRGLKTLDIRMEKHMKNGLAVARFLEGHPAVEKVLHPGLPSHPQHELAKRQSSGHSGMVTFFVKGGQDQCLLFIKSLKMIKLAESLGGYESLVKLPALMPPRYALDVNSNLIRFSVGLENAADIIADLDQALKASQKGKE